MTEHQELREILDYRKVYLEHGDDLVLRVAMLWDDWLIQHRQINGFPQTPEEASKEPMGRLWWR